MNTKLSAAAKNLQLNQLAPELNSGYLRIYSGSQPASPDVAIGAQVLLAELRFSATAFPAASGGVITANAITQDSAANATGTAAWFRCLKSDGTTAVIDGDAGLAAANLILPSLSIVQDIIVAVTALTHTIP